MYIDIETILDSANRNNYVVPVVSAFNMELVRGLIAAVDEVQTPLIVLMGQVQMAEHARPELMVPMIKALAEQTNVPVALILDHDRDWEKATWAYRQGFPFIMVDASIYDMKENVVRTRKAMELCHVRGLAMEDELGHIGQTATLDGYDVPLYTKPEKAVQSAQETGVDGLAIAYDTAHGDYSKDFILTVNFDVTKGMKQAVNMPLTLHGGSGSGSESIRKVMEAGINKVNITTEAFNACRDYVKNRLDEKPDLDYMSPMMGVEQGYKRTIEHSISLTDSERRAAGFKKKYALCHGIGQTDTGIGGQGYALQHQT